MSYTTLTLFTFLNTDPLQ